MTPVELIQYDYLVENILFPIADVPTAYTSVKVLKAKTGTSLSPVV